MKKLSVLGIIGGAALLTAAPFSLQWSQKNVALSLDSAEARIGRPGTALSVAGVHRRAYRRTVRRTVYGAGAAAAVGYGFGGYYGGYGYPVVFRTVLTVLRNWLWLWVVLRRLRLSGLLYRTLQSRPFFRLRVALLGLKGASASHEPTRRLNNAAICCAT